MRCSITICQRDSKTMSDATLDNNPTCELAVLNQRSNLKATVLMQRLSYPIETVCSDKINRNKRGLSFKDRESIGSMPPMHAASCLSHRGMNRPICRRGRARAD